MEWIEVVYKDGIVTQVRYPNTGPPGMSLKIIDPVLGRAASRSTTTETDDHVKRL